VRVEAEITEHKDAETEVLLPTLPNVIDVGEAEELNQLRETRQNIVG
jgi:hypothetical protein